MFRAKLISGSLGVLFLFTFIGCGNHEDSKWIDLNKTKQIEDDLKELPVIRIGLVPEQDIRQLATRYEPLAEYLSKKLNLKVVLVYLDSYGEICDKFIYKQLDAAFFGSFSYALTHAKVQVEPLVRPDYQGISTYRGLIVVRKDSNIKDVADMKGKRLSLVHQATYAGYLYPLFYFNEHGVKDVKKYFSKIVFSGSHDSTIFAVLRGEADIATPKDLMYQRVIKENPALEKKLVILSVSEPVPSNTLCVSKDFNPVLKNKLKEVLLQLANDPEAKPVLESLGASRFIETKDEEYRHLYETIKALGIDLNIYPYYKRPDMGFDRKGHV